MNLKILPALQRQLWEKLAGVELVRSFYLAGGTSIALQLEHRESVDLDFFRIDPFDSEKLIQALTPIGPLTINERSEGALTGFLSNVKLSFFSYPYPLIAPLHALEGISVADLQDVVAMKIIAIGQRGSKKDFIDLHAILRTGWNLEAIFKCVQRKFVNQNYNEIHLLKSLTHFQDAEEEPMPKMLASVTWPQIKLDLVREVRKFLKRS